MTCPECAGPQMPEHPAGALTFDHERTLCSLGKAQDATQHADADRLADPYGPTSIEREPTDAEQTLARHLGVADGLVTVVVTRITHGAAVRRRDPVVATPEEQPS